MATVRRHVDATPEQVWDVLADGWRYSNWVVGTSHMRAVDEHWPKPGSRLEHASAIWPLVVRDHTEVESADPPTALTLVAHGSHLGDARIVLGINAHPTGCEVVIAEETISGPGRLLRNPIGHALIARRNVETLARLAALAERRTPE